MLAVDGEQGRSATTAVGGEDEFDQAEAGEDHRTARDHAGAGALGPGEQRGGRVAGTWRAMREAEAARFDGPRRTGYAFAMAAIPARYALERGAWADAAALVAALAENVGWRQASLAIAAHVAGLTGAS